MKPELTVMSIRIQRSVRDAYAEAARAQNRSMAQQLRADIRRTILEFQRKRETAQWRLEHPYSLRDGSATRESTERS